MHHQPTGSVAEYVQGMEATNIDSVPIKANDVYLLTITLANYCR